jgi:RNA-directed DNA polymerase
MSLATPEKIRILQRKLYRKAKAEPAFRFYVLYDKIYREDILRHGYALARANAGAPGTDGMTFAAIEASGLDSWLAGLREELISKTYRPDPVRRVTIPKPDGGERPLGIPTIRDRVVQAAAKLVLEPIFEADFEDSAYGYRPARGAVDAVKEVHRHVCRGYTDVVDADLSRYFDSIPHDELLKSVARRIVDRHVLRLIKLWLKAPIEERDEEDGTRRIGGGNLLVPGNNDPWPEVRDTLNRSLLGWSNYFCHGTCRSAFRDVDQYVYERVRGFLARRHKMAGRGTKRFSRHVVYGERGLLRLERLPLPAPSRAMR